ncbi:type II toxin-antitoxin system VapC family toxin [Microlunatus elymi]|uniref:Type II toxin-antitoxin system VapC family toxin n=1 Tax=Microlunatus elymi TaxID=2596828 RepID=A0A516PZ52_9ACTN|nr:PIN domain-containing protein [Microlunatus elymi]QDP96271.1 type II toxin-antitoxin system VapC family toxin [Microlunatus elymi]
MSLIFDAGALSAMAGHRARLQELQRRELWPPRVPSVVLTEALTGDHRRDFQVNRLLRACRVDPVDEVQARYAARLRTATGRAGTISAVDAVVAAAADLTPGGVVLTSDPDDLRALVAHATHPIKIISV